MLKFGVPDKVSFDPDKFGFFTVGDYKTYSKHEAIELQNRTGKFPEWNFNKETFNKVNWTVEPDINVSELYKIRARQIRNSFDYVVLFYSGGCDSFNMIDSWIEAGCKIDEILCFWNYDTAGADVDHPNSELPLAAFKEIPKFQERTSFKLRVIENSQNMIDYLNEEKEIIYDINSPLWPHRNSIPAFRNKIKDYADLITSGKKVCFVWGIDKPQIFYDGKFYTQFFDIFGDVITTSTQQKYHQGWYDELFYWSPDLPELMVKQCQIVKRFLETCNDDQFYQFEHTPFGYNPVLKKYLTKTSFVKLLYPTYNTETFSYGKPSNKFYCIKDLWLVNGNLPESDKMKAITDYLVDSLGSYWLNDINDISKGIKKHASPKYYL